MMGRTDQANFRIARSRGDGPANVPQCSCDELPIDVLDTRHDGACAELPNALQRRTSHLLTHLGVGNQALDRVAQGNRVTGLDQYTRLSVGDKIGYSTNS